jgi:RNA polymerase sigma factor (sigma-70 family)
VPGPSRAPRPQVDEPALAARAAAGDRDAQREVFASQRALVHRTLYRILGSNRDMEDVVQDTFIEVFRGLHRFRGDSSLGRWCSTIAARVAWAYLDRRRPQAEPLDPDPALAAEDAVDAHRDAVAREAARRLYTALDRIAPPLRIAFALAVIDGRSIAEVAAITGASRVATKTRIWRARRELMKRAARDELLATYLVDLEEAR